MGNREALKLLQLEMRACSLCLESGYDITPGAIFSGIIGAKVMLIGQAPGVTEVEARRPFNASSGRRLFKWLGSAGWDETRFRQHQYLTAVTKCFPGKNNSGRGDRLPSKVEQKLCRDYLAREIRIIEPRVIIPVGGLAIKIFYPSNLKLDEIIGTAIIHPDSRVGMMDRLTANPGNIVDSIDAKLASNSIWIVPLPHPSGASAWTNKAQNLTLIEKAIVLLSDLRQMHHLD